MTGAVADLLLGWWAEAHPRRALPWRGAEVSPDLVACTEGLLAQTPAEVVGRAWGRVFAGCRDALDVVAVGWAGVRARVQGLGLHDRKASAVHGLAVALHAGARTAAALADVPGVGPYTAAMAALAVGGRGAPVDVNVERVAARCGAPDPVVWAGSLADAVAGRGPVPGAPTPGYAVVSAVMDVSHWYCRPRAPACLLCPLRGACAGAGVAP